MPIKKMGFLFALCIGAAFPAGCRSGSTETPPESATALPSPVSLEITASATVPNATESPIEESTLTVTPSSTLETPTLTATQTRTPIPTLSEEDAQDLLVHLFNTNNGCRLPCWWGITPGETNAQYALDFLKSFATDVEVNTVGVGPVEYYAYFDVPTAINVNGKFAFTLKVEDGTISSYFSELDWESDIDYSLAGLLHDYGPPSEVWINARPVMMDGQPRFTYVLHFPEEGIMTAKQMSAMVDDDSVIMCPQTSTASPNFLWLWSPGIPKSFAEVADGVLVNIGPAFQPPFLMLEDATDIDAEQFYTAYLDPHTDECFRSPAALWP